MAAKTSDKKTVEILFEEARMTALPERRLPLSRNLVTVELIWSKVGTAKKSASREVRFRKGASISPRSSGRSGASSVRRSTDTAASSFRSASR